MSRQNVQAYLKGVCRSEELVYVVEDEVVLELSNENGAWIRVKKLNDFAGLVKFRLNHKSSNHLAYALSTELAHFFVD